MARPDRIVRTHLRSRFVITTKDDKTWNAVLLDADATTLVLADVEALAPDGSATKADGHIYLPRVDVAYMQRT